MIWLWFEVVQVETAQIYDLTTCNQPFNLKLTIFNDVIQSKIKFERPSNKSFIAIFAHVFRWFLFENLLSIMK